MAVIKIKDGNGNWVGIPTVKGDKGDKGDTGDQGPQGVPGPGVPAGGSAGQVLKKNSSTNYDASWGSPLSYTPENAANKGAANGYAELDSGGKVPASQLPSYVDDVLEYAGTANFPATGETGKIYVATNTNLTYRWSGSAYVEISPSLALGETSSTAYRGDRGATAYTHSQTTGNPHNTTASNVGLGNVTNESKATMFTSPAFTGTPTAPTAATGTNTTQLATAALVYATAQLKSDSVSRTNSGTTLSPNTVYQYVQLSANLSVTLSAPTNTSIDNWYEFEFKTGATPYTLTINVPSGTLKWMNGTAPTIAANKTYSVSIKYYNDGSATQWLAVAGEF